MAGYAAGPLVVEIVRIVGVSCGRVRCALDRLGQEGRVRREPPSPGPGVRGITVTDGGRAPGAAAPSLVAPGLGRSPPDDPGAWSLIEDADTLDDRACLAAVQAAVEGDGDPEAADLALRFLQAAFPCRYGTTARRGRTTASASAPDLDGQLALSREWGQRGAIATLAGLGTEERRTVGG
ncbi:MAG: hypothetical protein OXG37_14315 [Actinomycetia bacterium]|nr:hypothetical protein [Actinomycetes bacterium]